MIRSLPARAALLLLVALSLVPRVALAFCGFYVGGADKKLFNNATIVVMMRDGTRTVLSMQNNYQGPPESFAMVVPVPVVLQKENVKTLPNEIFDRVDRAAAPRLVEYWEQDPCPPPHRYDQEEKLAMAPMSEASPTDKPGLGVKIEAKFAVGEYDVVILSADDALGLDTWLRRENYKIPEGAEPVLRPYVQGGMKFFVAKVDPKKVTFKGDQAMLSPLRFHYDSDTFSLPVRLGLINSAGTQDLIVHIFAHHQRYEVANYPNVTIPTNLDVAENARDEFGAFYAALFDRTLEENPKAVITEYAWPAGGCDPCPGPALSPQDLLTLGADVLPLPEGAHDDPEKPWMGIGARTGDLVLTRLHARYSKDALGEDLVFRAAPPITGGREVRNAKRELEHGAQPATYNAFQGRYAIRHPWRGPVTCLSPKRGVWGGPPPGERADISPKAAQDLAFAPRGTLELASFLRSDVPELRITAAGGRVSSAPLGWNVIIRVGTLLGMAGLVTGFVLWLRRRKARGNSTGTGKSGSAG